jgi:hypothetical protein
MLQVLRRGAGSIGARTNGSTHERKTTKLAGHFSQRRSQEQIRRDNLSRQRRKASGKYHFDNFCVLLRRDGQAQLVYKHAISTVMPLGPIQLQEIEPAAESA